jgi:hypothetical protein
MSSVAPRVPALKATWHGWVAEPFDVTILVQASIPPHVHATSLPAEMRLPRVTRRATAEDPELIRSGTVLVFSEKQTGIKRWQDSLQWSPSRVVEGNMLCYRQVVSDPRDPRRKRKVGKGRKAAKTEPSDEAPEYCVPQPEWTDQDLALFKKCAGSLVDTFDFKPNGLIKKTWTVSTGDDIIHVISYYTVEDVMQGRLPTVRNDPDICGIIPSPCFFWPKPDESDKTEIQFRKKVREACCADDRFQKYRVSCYEWVDAELQFLQSLEQVPIDASHQPSDDVLFAQATAMQSQVLFPIDALPISPIGDHFITMTLNQSIIQPGARRFTIYPPANGLLIPPPAHNPANLDQAPHGFQDDITWHRPMYGINKLDRDHSPNWFLEISEQQPANMPDHMLLPKFPSPSRDIYGHAEYGYSIEGGNEASYGTNGDGIKEEDDGLFREMMSEQNPKQEEIDEGIYKGLNDFDPVVR